MIKPIVSRNYLSRGQVDLIDFSDLNLVENMSPDGFTPYKYLLVYIDHFTKKINLAPLVRKTAENVCEILIVCFANKAHLIFYIRIMERNSQIIYYFKLCKILGPLPKLYMGNPGILSFRVQLSV